MQLKNCPTLRLMAFALVCAAILCPPRAVAQDKANLLVKITGLHNDRGKVCVRLWNGKKGFPTDEKKAFRMATVEIANGAAQALFSDIPYGSYAVSAWHDENSNGKFDLRFPGIPLEGYGNSNATRGRFGLPPFQPSAFTVIQKELSIPIVIRY